jgi:hypothetical protein
MKTSLLGTLLIGTSLAVAGCGGGTGGSGAAGGGSTAAVSTGVMTKGSTIVNGVRFEDTTANIFIDDTPKTAAALQTGMVVKVAGTVNDDGINGTAQRVKALIEVRGAVTAVFPAENPQRLVVLGQDVIVDDLTVYSNLANFGAIAVTTLIEVHGLRDGTNRIRATRIEASQPQMGDATVDEIRGVVSGGAAGLNPTTFNLGTQVVSASGAVIAPAGASYQNGSVVEVHCTVRPNCTPGAIFQASRVVVEDSEDSAFQPSSGQRLEAEGLISGFVAHPGNFSVAGTPVTTTVSTRFEGGISTDLKNDIKVEAEGSWNGTRLVASKIEFKRSVIRLQGTTANGAGQAFDLQIANGSYVVKIELDSLTSGSLPANGLACVQVRGQRKIGAATLTVTAGEINTSCSNGDRHFIQAPVEVEVPENTITLLGFSLDVSNPTDTPNQWVDTNDLPLTRTAFFNAVTAATTNAAGISVPGTLVKVTFDSGASTVRQAELED